MKTPDRAMSYGIIGMGKVGSYFYRQILTRQSTCLWVVSSQFDNTLHTLVYKNTHSIIFSSNIILLCVHDDQIHAVSQAIPDHIAQDALVVHTSGTHDYRILSEHIPRRGVLYPLQTFGVDTDVLHAIKMPFVIEAEHAKDLSLLRKVVLDLDGTAYELDAQQKSALHLGAVFANNFTHFILGQALDILNQHHIPSEIMKPLLAQTIQNAWHQDNAMRQTGPASRGDLNTLAKHQKELRQKNEDKLELYNLLTKYIQQLT